MKAFRTPGIVVLLLAVLAFFLVMAGPWANDTSSDEDQRMTIKRKEMVKTQIAGRDVKDPRVLDALEKVKRHLFVQDGYKDNAYDDRPLPIGEGQTISQPYIVGKMSELMELTPSDKVLEIGTGSGYQAAVLAELAGEVYTIEIVDTLCKRAGEVLSQLGYANVHVRCGDGYGGWPEQAPFDAIMVTAAPEHVPKPLLDQLKPGGRLVIPVGGMQQELLLYSKSSDGEITKKRIIPVRFVPMTGEAQKK